MGHNMYNKPDLYLGQHYPVGSNSWVILGASPQTACNLFQNHVISILLKQETYVLHLAQSSKCGGELVWDGIRGSVLIEVFRLAFNC